MDNKKAKHKAIIEVRRRTLAPMSSCKEALDIANWDVEKACLNIARSVHDKKNGNSHDSYGIVCLYSHSFGRVGVMVEIGCESGYVAKSREFLRLANTIAVHIAWANPLRIDNSGADGALEQIFGHDASLMDQKELKESNGEKTIRQLVQELSDKVGERIEIRHFSRFEIGQSPVQQ